MNNTEMITIGAVQGTFAFTYTDKNPYYKCICRRCKEENIWTEEQAIEHNNVCINNVIPDDLRVLCKDRQSTAIGTIVESEKNGTTECIAYRNSRDVDVLFYANNAIAMHREWKSFVNGSIKNPEGNAWKYVGMSKIMNCGMNATIIAYRKAHDIDVVFDDGYTLTNVNFSTFKAGALNNPNVKRTKSNRVGEKIISCQGLEMEIVEYTDAEHIKVKFLFDGTIVDSMYKMFIKGGIKHPTYYQDSKIGEKYIAKNGLEMEIIAYVNNSDCTVRFEDGVERKAIYSEVKRGCIKHPELSLKKECTYKGFIAKYAFSNDDEVYYKCKCNICGLEDILTPQQMIAHYNLIHK